MVSLKNRHEVGSSVDHVTSVVFVVVAAATAPPTNRAVASMEASATTRHPRPLNEMFLLLTRVMNDGGDEQGDEGRNEKASDDQECDADCLGHGMDDVLDERRHRMTKSHRVDTPQQTLSQLCRSDLLPHRPA